MPVTILPTKLSIPPLRQSRVPRGRLTDRLSAGIHRKLTLVSAPAGFGKSSLVAEWLSTWPGPAGWISLDDGDGEISSFLSYLVAAVGPITGRGDELLALARSPRSEAEATLSSLIADLSLLDDELVLVLDDYHLVDSTAVDSALQFLVDNLPHRMHLIITTREDPQLGLARLRANDALTELRAADLRFDVDEVRRFLDEVMGLDLSERAIATLEGRTEGWIAGLQLAALSLQGVGDRERFVEAFSGSHRYVLDYLVEDVLDRLPHNVRDFLDQTSILDRFCAGLCDAVTGHDDSRAMIDYLDRSNLFVIALDTEREWYRFHHLFLDLLRSRAAEPDQETERRHQRASAWFSRNDLPLEAFSHAVAARDTVRAAEILEGDGLPLHYRGAYAPVERWLVALTPAELDERPALRIACAWVLTTRGAPLEEVDALLDPAEQAVRAMDVGSRRDDLRGQIAGIRALSSITRGDLAPIIAHATEALDLVDPRNRPVRTTLAWSLGYAHQMLDELEPARQAFERSISEGRASGNLVITVGATISLGQVYERERRLEHARRTYHEALRLCGDPPLPYACEAYLGLARVQYEMNDLVQACENARRAYEVGQRLANVDTTGMALVLEARIDLAERSLETATEAAKRAAHALHDRGLEHRDADLAGVNVAIHLARGKPAAAMHAAQEFDLTDRIAEVLIREGDPAGALELLGTYVRTDEPTAIRINLPSHILAAAALWSAGDRPEATRKMASILAAVASEGCVRSFVDRGVPVLAILREPDLRLRHPDFVAAVFDACGEYESGPLAEPLSRRELDVLTLIADGLSNREIGERLYIALDTVKGHTRRIYEKLGVGRRTEAVARATEIGLLP